MTTSNSWSAISASKSATVTTTSSCWANRPRWIAAAVILKHLYVETQPLKGGKVTDIIPDMVHLAIQESRVLEQERRHQASPYGKEVTVKTKRGLIKPHPPIRPSTSPISSATTSVSA
ncbi:hypothetical protein ACLK1W_03515 [Escherichia coli]